MLKKIKAYIGRISVFLLGLAFALPGVASAAADTDLVDVIATSTQIAQDNKSVMIGFYVALGLVSLGIGLSKGAILTAIRWIKRALFGGRRR